MKENVIEALQGLGFQLEEVENLGYYFSYEGKNYMYLTNNDDEDFLSIALPGIYDLEEDNHAKYIAMLEKMNANPKYVKAYTLADSLWLFYERELFGGEDLKQIISRMILHLDAALYTSRQVLAEIEKAYEESEDEGNGLEDAEVLSETADTENDE